MKRHSAQRMNLQNSQTSIDKSNEVPAINGKPSNHTLRMAIHSILVASAMNMAITERAEASPDPCTYNVFTVCQGDQSQGIIESGPVVFVYNLTKPITPANGQVGILVNEYTAGSGGLVWDGTIATQPAVILSWNGSGGSISTQFERGIAARAYMVPFFAGRAGDVTVVAAGGQIYTSGGGLYDSIFAESYGQESKLELPTDGGNVIVDNSADLFNSSFYGRGIYAHSWATYSGTGGTVNVTSNAHIETTGQYAHGIFALSEGGYGANGSSGLSGSSGVPGGIGGDVTVNGSGFIATNYFDSDGILAISRGGIGGSGGDGYVASAGNGVFGGRAGNVAVDGSWTIYTHLSNSSGIYAESLGGEGGQGGKGYTFGSGGDGGGSGNGGTVTVNSRGEIYTYGDFSYGIFAHSVGGFAGGGGSSYGVVGYGGSGESAGYGSEVDVTNSGAIATTGAQSHGIVAQSIGGGGGAGGGSGGVVAVGGSGAAGGNGGVVSVTNTNSITATGAGARGIFAQSIGGGGGDGGDSAGVGAIGGTGSGTSDSNTVTINNAANITSAATSIYAESIGGGGGSGGSSVGWFSVGGNGGAGGTAQKVSVTSSGSLISTEDNSSAIFAHSVGGGGGNGGGAIAGGVLTSVALGGKGAHAGDGGEVFVQSDSGNISTGAVDANGDVISGNGSSGIYAQSIGGGGGNGGFAISAAVSTGGAIAIGIGGHADAGGNANKVTVENSSNIQTMGSDATALFAQSIGGGGGNGGFAVSMAVGDGFAGSAAIGGGGAGGGDAELVKVTSSGDLNTYGDRSYGLLAQSVGGGGGNGGFAIAGTITASGVGAAFALGGNGDHGGIGQDVTVDSSSNITTHGDDAHGLFAQSLGGGGGSGGFSVAGSISLGGAADFAMGGSGSGGGSAGAVIVGNTQATTGTIHTYGDDSYGLLAESIGGGGGSGGFAVAGSITLSASAQLALGGKGGTGSNAGIVTVNASNSIMTEGDNAHGLFAQSLGGGGGNGGFAVAGSISFQSGSVGAAIGGSGDGGGDGNVVMVDSSGEQIITLSQHSYGLTAQSVGGGGGDGGFAVAGSVTNGPAATLSMGGSGAHGGFGNAVTILSTTSITTYGDDSHALFAQSLGGGGGSGGFSVDGSISSDSGTLGASIGGSGGPGGNSSAVIVGTVDAPTSGTLITQGDRSYGLIAESIGGGGGDGGFSIAGGITQGAGVKLALGGNGDYGGNSSTVSVVSDNSISTSGDDSHALFAQSIGGGGGNGGFSVAGSISSQQGSLNASIGGFGKGGGNAAEVDVTSNGQMIVTAGDDAHGIFAQSVGGGGGNGGFSVAGSVSKKQSVNLSLGGFGAGGGYSGDVNVLSSTSIYTSGTQSYGLFAQSLGGGGGNGGFSIAGSLFSTDTSDPTISASVGGFGAGGGHSGSVNVGSAMDAISGTIQTTGDESHAVFAQSVGGGGGNGGFSIAGGVNKSPNVDFSVGGQGGKGGDAEAVKVFTAANVSTQGANANGIFAQSLGGGGGNGGFSIAGSATTDVTSVTASVGGFGGTAGNADEVDVNNSGQVVTMGDQSIGLFAQSVGGGGGNGGFSIAGSLGAPPGKNTQGAKNINFSVGGFGGSAGHGGVVNVINDGAIETYGDSSYGILAQSVGGGGGNGGFAAAGSLNISSQSSNKTTTASIAVSVGGDGGNGDVGGNVSVTNQQSVITHGDDARGIYAYSTGGGGGDGGASFSINTALGKVSKGNGLTFELSIGGYGGNGDIGGEVNVVNDGMVSTDGMNADAIFAQSVGGGGGSGGSSHAASLDFTADNPFSKSDEAKGDDSKWNFSATIGGNGGKGENGNVVTVNNTAMLITQGTHARGIVAQSIGGGGGTGGDGISGTGLPQLDLATDLLDLKDKNYLDVRDWSVSVGGNGGENGSGQTVTVTNSGSIMTLGLASTAIFAQSVGGGGGEVQNFASAQSGDGGTASSGISGRFALGGGGGAAGDGGVVTVTNSADIETFGDDAYGIFAQSVGGGGGVAGNVDRGLADGLGVVPSLNIGIGLAFGQSGGSGGNGGDVTVTNVGSVTTHGDGAFGIIAQSIGGGGGAAGGLGDDYVGLSLQNFYGSTGGSGNSGVVTVNQTGNITASGSQAIGIFAQSNTTNGFSKAVNITVNGDIAATGRGSFGIVAQSLGAASTDNTQSSDDITININNGTISGGRGFLASETDANTIAAQTDFDMGAAINFRDGRNNILNNHGTAGNDVSRMAILSGNGNETINNYGSIVGNVNLGAGRNQLNNNGGATLVSGSTMYLGSGNMLINNGTWSVGDVHAITTTTVTGNVTQTQTGQLLVDIDRATGNSDHIDVVQGGTAALSGSISVQEQDAQYIKPGTEQFVLMSAEGGITTNALSLTSMPSIITKYSISTADIDMVTGKSLELILNATTDFANNPNGVVLTRNQHALGVYFNAVQMAGSSPALADTIKQVVSSTTGDQLKTSYDMLSPASYAVTEIGMISNNKSFSNAMLSCKQASGDNHFVSEGRCGWLAATDYQQNQSTTVTQNGFRHDSAALAGGLQIAINDQWHLGFAASSGDDKISADRMDMSDAQYSSGGMTQLGVVAKGNFGPTTVAAGLTGGHGSYASQRSSLLSDWAGSTQTMHFYALQLHVTHAFDKGNWYWRPMLDANVQRVNRDAFDETGAGGNNLSVAASNDVFTTLTPAVEFGRDLIMGDCTARLFTRIGVSRLLSGSNVALTTTLEGAPANVAPFTVYQPINKTAADITTGVDIFSAKGAVLHIGYVGQWSSHNRLGGGEMKLSVPF